MTEHRRDNDARRADRAYKMWQEGLARGLANLDWYREEIQEERPTITGLVIRCDPGDEEGVLVVIKGYEGTVWKVAFHRADTISAAVSEVGNRLRNGSLRWKEDAYADSK